MKKLTHFELPPFAYAGLSVITLLLGLSAAALTAHLFIIGLHHTDKDPQIQTALAMLGVLFTVAELVCFYATTSLPNHFWKARSALITLGVALIVFEIGTVAITQLAFAKSAEIATDSDSTRATELRATITQKRETIASIRNAAASQATSKFRESRQTAATQLQQAIDLERELAPIQNELTALDRAKQPTLASILKTEDALLYFILLRATLLAGIVAAMTAASGSLFRHFLNLRALRAANPGVEFVDLMSPQGVEEDTAIEEETPPSLSDSLPHLLGLMQEGSLRPTVRDLTQRGLSSTQAREVLEALAASGSLIRVGRGFIVRKSSAPTTTKPTPARIELSPPPPLRSDPPAALSSEESDPEKIAAAKWHQQHGFSEVSSKDSGQVNTAFGAVKPEPAIISGEPQVNPE